jgi:hypothetical protein
MKPGKYDRTHEVLITGAELRELKQLDLAESFGLDRRIEQYQGRRPIGVYRWDLECLLAAVSVAMDGQSPFITRQGRVTLRRLHDRLQAVYDAAYPPLRV